MTQTIQLQSIGKVPAVEASELREGDVRMYNFGSTGLVIKVIEKTPKTLTVITYENGKYYISDVRKTSLVAIHKRDQDVSEHKPVEAYNVSSKTKGMVNVSEYFEEATEAQQEPAQKEVTTNEEEQTEMIEQTKTLIFEGAGMEKAESSVQSGVGNCRIRTRIRNNDGRLIYLEMGGFQKSWNDKREILKGLSIVGHIDHVYYADSEWDSNRGYSDRFREAQRGHFEYNKENIIEWVNENLNCSFDNMEVINDNSVRVHDTEEPLCDCSNGEYEPYKDPEYHISLLSNVEPLYEYPRNRLAHYAISYEFVSQYNSLRKWMDERSEAEKKNFPNYKYQVSFYWDEKGIIRSAQISARQNFCTMGLNLESLVPVINDALKCGKAVELLKA